MTTGNVDGGDVLGLDSGLAALQRSPEFRGSVEPLDGHHCNDHFALLYERPEEQFDALVPFLRQGIERGERCMIVIDELDRDDTVAAMREASVDVDAALESGRLSFHTVRETYLRDGTFDPDEMIEFYADAIAEATAEHAALRVAAETTWLQTTETDVADFMEYEAKVNDLFDDEDCIAMCTYDRRAFPPEVVRDIVRTHPHLIYDGTVCHNVYHTPPEEFFGPEQPSREVDRMMNTLLERSEAKTELQERERYLRRQNEITADPDRSFEEKLQALFDLGCERFDLELGAMARVDTEADRFQIEHVSDDHEHFEPGLELPLSETYCTAATDSGGAASVDDPVEAGYDDIHVYREFGIKAYLGTYVEVEDDRDRTFFFVSSTPREGGFSEDERTFQRLIGQWVKYELERRQRERQLERSNAVVEALGDPVYAVDDEGRFTFVNEAFGAVFGYERDEILGEHVSVLMDEPGIERARELIDELLADEERRSGIFERTAVTASGERRHCEDHMALLPPGADEPFRGTAGVVRDVTERKKRETELELFRNLIDRSNDGVFVIDPDTGQFLDVNDTACLRLGYDRAELLELSVPDIEQQLSGRADWQRYVEDVEAEGRTTFEGIRERKDGTTFPVEVSDVYVEFDDAYVLAIARDVTERKERNRFLRELHETTASPTLAFEEKIEQLLALGQEWFGLDVGYFASCDVDADRFEVVEAVGSHPGIQPGDAGSVSGTYLEEVVDASQPVSIADTAAEGGEGAPPDDTYGLDACIGTSLDVDGELGGTLCFGARTSRTEPFTDAERASLELMGQWISYELEQQRHERRLAALNELSRDLMNAETGEELAEMTVDHAQSTLQLPVLAIVNYDETTGELAPAARTRRAADELPITALCDSGGGPCWEAFVANETQAVSDVASVDGGSDDLTEVIAIPLENQELFVTATDAPDGFSPSERDFQETTAATIEAACARLDRERQLQERERALEEQNETLARLDRVNDIIRSIDNSLVQASTRSEIETVVCEQLADAGPYELAWIGEHDAVAGEVGPIEWAGVEKGYLDGIRITTDDSPEGRGPTSRAVETHEPQVVNDILGDRSFEPWRQAALNRGYHATIALPLAYEDTLYGVLNVYAGQPGLFDDLEKAVLAELADTIAYAINAVESKKALVSDEVTELEFVVDDGRLGVVDLIEETGCEFSHESLVPRTDGRLRAFFCTRGAPAAAVLATEPRLPASDLELVADREEDGEPVCLFQATLTDESLPATVLDHGGRISGIDATDGTATVTVHLAGDANVREFSEMFRTNYPDSELVAQRSREVSRRTPSEFTAALTEELTARQQEVLQMAFFSGYFESPRVRTGSEIAADLDIAQPTFNTHLRTAQRKLCHLLFEDESSPA